MLLDSFVGKRMKTFGAPNWIRTSGLVLTKDALCRLSYGSFGAGDGNRTRRAYATAWKAVSTPCGLTRKNTYDPQWALHRLKPVCAPARIRT